MGVGFEARSATVRALLAVLVLAGPSRAWAEAPALPALGADLTRTSVSGLSSGAFMTSQLYIAHSDMMVGAGIVAGGPYYCAGSWAANTLVQNATTACMNPLTRSVGPNVPVLVEKARAFAAAGLIDPLENLADDRVYLFSGRSDRGSRATARSRSR